jgi:SAM-dependent methyltransferase
VTASYDLGVERYEQLWSPVILPAAAGLVPWLALRQRDLVLDVGGGTGALVGAIHGAAPDTRVVVVDASWEMLRVARLRRQVPAVRADAVALPVADHRVAAVVLAYVLFHVADPLAALIEATRVLERGGRVGTVTWAWERAERAQMIWNEALAEAGVPALPPRRVDAGLDSPRALEMLLSRAALTPVRIWAERLCQQWTPDSFWALVTGSGVNRQRLGLVEPPVRAELLARLQNQLSQLGPDDYSWEGEVVCAVAAKACERAKPTEGVLR